MHATFEQLIDIKDGGINSQSAHVEQCERCQMELAHLCNIGDKLFDAVDQAPGVEAWHKILAASELNESAIENVHAIAAARQHNPLSRAIYTLAASIAFVGVFGVFMLSQQTSVQQQATNQMQASLEQLMLNSRGLENVLQQVVVQQDNLGADDRAAAERLYWRLTYVDQELQTAKTAEPKDDERIKILWSDRVDVLNELNRLFYQRQDAIVTAEY